jgi:hypothetical protein
MVIQASDLSSNDLPGHMDFLHARLTLGHIPHREDVLARLVMSLAPGGLILIEDWYTRDTRMVMAAPSDEDAELYNRFQDTMGGLFDAGGTDRGWARRVHGRMMRLGLADVHSEITTPVWVGGDAGCRLIQSSISQMSQRLLNSGVLIADELDKVRALLDDPRFVLAGHQLVSTSGTRPK